MISPPRTVAGTRFTSCYRPNRVWDREKNLVQRWGKQSAWTYTNNNQLTGVSHTNGSFANESFSYDANGNETGTGYTTSTGNEQTASPGYTYTYDADGNMITSTQTSTGDVWTYSCDFRNRMTSAVEKTSAANRRRPPFRLENELKLRGGPPWACMLGPAVAACDHDSETTGLTCGVLLIPLSTTAITFTTTADPVGLHHAFLPPS
jgi:hypothetical protein